MAKEITRDDVTKIVKDELDKHFSKIFETEMHKIISNANSKSRKEIINIIKKTITSVHKFMYIRKDVWGSDIK